MTKPKVFDIARCLRGRLGVITSIRKGVYYGYSIDPSRRGKPWQSKRPTVVGRVKVVPADD